ncbi:MAG: DUF1365 domain-containing protein [Myxococcota bacterium]
MSAAWLYEGRVEHVRLDPVARRFRYRIGLAYLDLERLDEAFAESRWASVRGMAPLGWRRRDHFGDSERPLVDCVREHVARAAGRAPAGPVRLLTQLRHFGYGFNPASFFYCFEDDGRTLAGVLVEVTNTPWGERHLYWSGRRPGSTAPGVDRSLAKAFHVSPFMGMDSDYGFHFGLPDAALGLSIDCRREGRRFFGARLELVRRPWTARELARHAAVHCMGPARLHAAIHWQALRLLAAGVPFHSHPRRPSDALVATDGTDLSEEASIR